ncbi:GNAT family N-acetyltransferase [Herbaspirillum chlorophenolicum]|jgi:predicted GNAT family N-acyltransferase|uniref:GNAT family N-acetyltransferase n=1 Tax=Herbaspirillum chlorophenolicum TaxID=211589 RepID=A0ABW8EVC1_9BURK
MTVHQLCPSTDETEKLTIKIVEDETERLKAMLVRAIVYMHEQKCPFHEEFDLNDHTATQIIGLAGDGEPVLTARIRYFNGFAKIERLSIRSEYRGKGYGHRLLSFALQLCRQKGFSQFYLHAQLRYENFYSEYGFKPVGGNFGFSDYEYAEMVLVDAEPHAQPSKQIGIAPMTLNRPENSPFSLGPLEHRPSVERSTLHAN